MAALDDPMTGEELAQIRQRVGVRRSAFCALAKIDSNKLSHYETNQMRIPAEFARHVRLLEAPASNPRRVGIGTFGDKYVVLRFSLLEAVELWQIDVLPIIHDNRQSAVLAAKDYARLHNFEFVPIGF